ncbi:MAG: phenylalanine--tRNA ligase subunit beta [Chloroflexota bacterium]|nr:phenylalanine--tRNA ligase subunit beta [Chloroflexota bacterium]
MPSLKVPVSWLRDYVDVSVSSDEIAERLHMAGMEVDHVERTWDWDKIWVARITALERHPNADKLLLATVDYGDGRTRQVVTGAPNLAVGAIVPYAEVGAAYKDAHNDGTMAVLEPKKMRGIMSEGMVMSALELGIGPDHEGILLLDPQAPVGARLRDVLGETVIQFEIAPNRPDALSLTGIAREAAAILGTPYRAPAMEPLPHRLDPSLLVVRIEDDDACPRFTAAYLTGVRMGTSPAWMQQRLIAAGMRPISNVVDITNYVMLEIGQPLHAYDAERLRGRALVARLARAGEAVRTLDGVDRILRASDLVIADEERVLGLAGIMGGEDSEIREGTTEVALEAASFEPRRTRRTTDAHGLGGSGGSAAARRFALDLSPELPPLGLARAVHLLRELAGATVVGAVDVYPRPRQVPNVKLRFSDIGRVLGAEVGRDEAVDALRRLGFAYAELGDQLVVTPPAIRTDIGIPEDIVEEVARIVGYDTIPTRLPTGVLPLHERHPLERMRERVRDALVGFGLQETISYALIDEAWLRRLTPDGSPLAPEPLRVTNPTSAQQGIVRPTLRASLLDTASRNMKHRKGLAIFEIDPVYLPRPGDLPEERWTVGVVLCGLAEPVREGETWLTPERVFEVSDLQGVIDGLHRATRSGRGTPEVGAPGLHPGRSWRLVDGARDAVVAGQLDPRVAEMWELPPATFVAEVDLALLLASVRPNAALTPPRYPAAWRDLAFVVDDATAWRDVETDIRAAGAKGGLEDVALRDLYRGAQVPAGKKSFAVRLTFRSPAGTLSDADVDRAVAKIEARLLHRFGATIRAS